MVSENQDAVISNVILIGFFLSLPLILYLTRALEKRIHRIGGNGFLPGLLVFMGCFLVLLLPALLVSFLPAPTGDPAEPAENAESETADLPTQLLSIVMFQVPVGLAAVIVVYSVWRRWGLIESGFGIRKPVTALGFGFAGYFAFIPVYFLFCIIKDFFFDDESQKVVQELFLNPELRHSPVILICIGFLIPLYEEVLFRGFLLGGLLYFVKGWGSIVISAVVFALAHELQAMIPIFSLGLLLGYLRERTGSIWPAVAIHAFHNTLMVLIIPFFIE